MFSVNSYAKIKEVVEKKDNYTVCKISISKKNKATNQYETTFAGNVRFCSQAHLQVPKAEQRIKITSCSVSNCYTKDGKLEFLKYPQYTIFAYELQSDNVAQNSTPTLYTMDNDSDLIPF